MGLFSKRNRKLDQSKSRKKGTDIELTEEELDKNLGTIAKSGSLKFKEENENSKKRDKDMHEGMKMLDNAFFMLWD